MIVVNLGPVDQSGRSINICRVLAGNTRLNNALEKNIPEKTIKMITYTGIRNIKIKEESILFKYILYLDCNSTNAFLRYLLLFIKLVYIVVSVSILIVEHKIELIINRVLLYINTTNIEHTYAKSKIEDTTESYDEVKYSSIIDNNKNIYQTGEFTKLIEELDNYNKTDMASQEYKNISNIFDNDVSDIDDISSRDKIERAKKTKENKTEIADKNNEVFEFYTFCQAIEGVVLFVAPPTPTILFPMLLAKVLGMKVVIDWHRIEANKPSLFEQLLSKLADCNTVVVSEMERLFKENKIERTVLLTDIQLTRQASAQMGIDEEIPERAEYFKYLREKYPEYKERLSNLNLADKIGVCSTSYSKEENVDELLKALDHISPSTTGILFITTKTPISYTHPRIRIVQVFLDYPDYIQLLQVSDFGISTHQCNYDFPLKIVDYLNCHLKVLSHPSTPVLSDSLLESSITRYTDKNSLLIELNRLYSHNSQSA
ncbi:hypothetical protein NEOKW01_1658 [Nematocida sp. AWRm80]|nr:hypothetical protein NEOKW01_1658 [Nematocida sp. AWRm80]